MFSGLCAFQFRKREKRLQVEVTLCVVEADALDDLLQSLLVVGIAYQHSIWQVFEFCLKIVNSTKRIENPMHTANECAFALSGGLAASGPLSFCQKNFSELKMQKAEHLFFRRCSALLYFFSGSMMRFSTFGLLQVLFAEVFNVFRPRYFATAPCSAEKFFR